MPKRIIEASPSELAHLNGQQLMDSIRVSGGRAVAAETVAFQPSLVAGVSNGALAAALGADIIHFNHYDVDKPQIGGMKSTPRGIAAWKKAGVSIEPTAEVEGPPAGFLDQLGFGVTFQDLRSLIGRVVGVSLEILWDQSDAPRGRQATPETGAKALQQGAAYLTVIATPAHAPEVLAKNMQILRAGLGAEVMLVAGRMPWGGSRPGAPDFLMPDEVELVVKAGANMVVLPAPGTMAVATLEKVREAVETAHRLGALAEITIGTSQESADEETVRRLALDSKLTGADLYDIGDGGFVGISPPENILAFATAIKGRRHTYRRMADRS
jgi:hypothetical protein